MTALIPTQAHDDDRLIALWLAGRPASTAAAYRFEVARFRAFVARPLAAVTVGDLHAYAASLGDLAPATQRRALSAVKSLLAYAVRLGYLPFDAGQVIHLRRGRDTTAERILSEPDVLRLLALETDPRNAALLYTLYATGGRVSEVCGLRWRDVATGTDGRLFLTLYGKGDKTRVVTLEGKSRAAVLLLQLRTPDASPDAPVFAGRPGAPLSRAQAWRVVKVAAKRAGITASPSPHWMRHAHVSHALDRGAPAHLVQATVGHASLATTTGYSHLRPGESSARYLAI